VRGTARLAALVALAGLAAVTGMQDAGADGRIYRWTDADGKVHFGDRPADRSRAEEVLIRETAPPDPELEVRRQREQKLLDVFEQENAEEKEAAQLEQKNREQARRNCTSARKRLARYEAASGVYVKDEEGNPEVLPASALDRARADIRKEVEYWCGG